MAAKVWIGIRSRTEHLQRLAVVFDIELRLKIVTELYMREMSPNEFFEEFGGGTISRVNRNFERLEETGWLRLVRIEGPGGRRRGGEEHFYRATELAFCDAETWSLLPRSIRVAWSWNSFKQIAWRMREALEAAGPEGSPFRHFTSTPLLLDQAGWQRMIEVADSRFTGFFDEQEDAQRRALSAEEELTRASTLLFAFESPLGGAAGLVPDLMELSKEPLIPFSKRLAFVFGDEISMAIVDQANHGQTSVPQFHREHGGACSQDGVRHRFRRLDKVWLTQVGEKTGGRRRGAVEKFFVAAVPAMDDGPWSDPPEWLKGTKGWTSFESFCMQVIEAMKAGTFDARKDRYLTWSFLQLDRLGWAKTIDALEATRSAGLEEEKRARASMKASDAGAVKMTLGLAAFEGPHESTKEP